MKKPPPQETINLGNFNYSSLQSMMVFYSVPSSHVRPLLKGTGLEPGIFDGKALVNLNFERYGGFGSNYSSFIDEVEFNVVAYPRFRAGSEPKLSVSGYLNGGDQSKTYGNYRINVPCDSEPAVNAGRDKFGEVKFVASFDFNVPHINNPDVKTWWIRCYTTKSKPKSQLPYIFDLKVDPTGKDFPASTLSPFSPIPAYANLPNNQSKSRAKKHMITSSRVVFGLFESYYNPQTEGKSIKPLPEGSVELIVGKAKHKMQKEMASVFKNDPPAVGILIFNSPPAASSGHTKLVEPI